MLSYPIVHDGRTYAPDGEVPELTSRQLNCGHLARPGNLSAGYVLWSGYTMCYECAAQQEAADFSGAVTYMTYLTSDRRKLTTWAGSVLAHVTSITVSRNLLTPTGGWYRRLYLRAEGPDGSRWYGSGSAGADLVTLHRCKRQGTS